MASLSDVFKAYDIRGVVPDQLNATQFRAIGMAVARFTGDTTLLVARDMRESGVPTLAGVRRRCPVGRGDGHRPRPRLHRPAVLRRRQPRRPRGDVHRLAQPRSLQRPQAVPVGRPAHRPGHRAGRDPATAESLLDSGDRAARPSWTPDRLAPLEERSRRSTSTPSTSARSSTSARCGRCGWWPTPPTAWAAWSSRRSFEGLPFELEILFAELDGTFPNHPADPIQPENQVALKQAVLASKADIGLAFDGDADRVFLVDERARAVSGSLTTALVASAMLEKHPGRDRPLQLHLLPGGPRGHRRQGRHRRADPGRATPSSSR